MLISIVAPCYNEEAVVARFHAQVQKVAEELLPLGHDMEFVYVDDGSHDRTLAVLRQLADLDARVRYVSFSRNFGKEAALLAGLRHASGDAVVDVGVPVQRAADETVEQGQVRGDQIGERRLVAGLRRPDQGIAIPGDRIALSLRHGISPLTAPEPPGLVERAASAGRVAGGDRWPLCGRAALHVQECVPGRKQPPHAGSLGMC